MDTQTPGLVRLAKGAVQVARPFLFLFLLLFSLFTFISCQGPTRLAVLADPPPAPVLPPPPPDEEEDTGIRNIVCVSGEVITPQYLSLGNGLTVLQAIDACGGFSPTANHHEVQILRQQTVIRFDAVTALRNSSADIPLQPEDQIYVTRSFY